MVHVHNIGFRDEIQKSEILVPILKHLFRDSLSELQNDMMISKIVDKYCSYVASTKILLQNIQLTSHYIRKPPKFW